jgi:hypothetical protein
VHSVPLQNSNRRAHTELEGTPGYVSSGEGEWSRKAGHGAKVNFEPVRLRGYNKPLATLIAETERRIKHMEVELRLTERSETKKRERLAHDLGIKYRFYTTLLIERDGK